MGGMPEPRVEQRMREDWDRRAREDACYYVAFGRRQQPAEEFFATAADVLRAIRSEFQRFPSSVNFGDLSALEIGCGPGRLLVPLSREFGRIAGVDVSREMVELARRNLEGCPNARAEMTSGSDLAGFADETFDFCYSYAVFQHIPSREVVLRYLREARRVLKLGGLLKCQFNGLPETSCRDADTWRGARFSAGEIRDFCREHDFQLLSLDGESTPDLWMCARKRPAGWTRSLKPVSGARFVEIGNTYTPDRLVPVSGRFSSASLQVENLSADADINNLEAEIGRWRALPCYIGELAPAQGPSRALTQVNVFLPPGVITGLLPVRLRMLGEPATPFGRLRVIPAPPRVPRVLRVTDGINLTAGSRIETRSIKVDVEEAGPDAEIAADIDGMPLCDLDIVCVDPLPERYSLTADLPDQIAAGPHWLHVRLRGRELASVLLDVTGPGAG